ncbi:FAD-dependent oxidoreductase [Mycobacterium sp. Root265]|uniref:FAD-dependent oxidoreductase n=1 Tax=Mycobacterium sp. Root265 TaxID=1736504 RepID=UPI000AAC0B3E|nr:FAD-dependent monooxygenase [Mycobacterium sp. Root265]
MVFLGERAVVLGGSIGGLLAARVLAEHYRNVTIVERDVLTDEPTARRGVPQGRHAHVLLARSSMILADLFPGFHDDLAADGVSSLSGGDLSKLRIAFGGHEFTHSPDATTTDTSELHFATRPLLERSIRRRILALPKVALLDGHDVVGLMSTPGGARVTGVQLVGDGEAKSVDADLVVDATGRGSRTPVFLEELGYGRPPEDELVVKLAYASQLFQMPRSALPEQSLAYFPEPGRPTTWALVGYENDSWILTVGSMVGHPPPADLSELLAFGEGFAPEHALAAVRSATPIGGVDHYRVPSNRWRRYDKMKRFPQGLIVFGDAICSFNPIYGQGMTMAAIESTLLRDCLRHGDRDLPQRFLRKASRKLRVAWQTAVGSDLSLPEVDGPRPLSMRLSNAYLDWVLTAAETDPHTAIQLARVTGMVDSPMRLFRPGFVVHVARANRSGREPRSEGNRGPRPPFTAATARRVTPTSASRD